MAKIEREIIHLALAGFTSEKATIRLAKKYLRTTRSPKVKRAMRFVLSFELSPAELAKETYFRERAGL
jgi:hypothetical protein